VAYAGRNRLAARGGGEERGGAGWLSVPRRRCCRLESARDTHTGRQIEPALIWTTLNSFHRNNFLSPDETLFPHND